MLSSSGALVVPAELRDGPLALAEASIRTHMEPQPRLGLGADLNLRGIASACIDLSDGLSLDLARLCRASGVRARVAEASLPIAPGLLAWERYFGREPLDAALSGGEDYELLFTVPDESGIDALREACEVPVTRIGEVTAVGDDGRVELVRRDGSIAPLTPAGWDHFR